MSIDRRLEERLKAIEGNQPGRLRLQMPDGSSRTVNSGRWFAMMDELGKGIIKPDTADVIAATGDDGSEGRMREVIQCLAAGQAQVAEMDAAQGTEGTEATIQ